MKTSVRALLLLFAGLTLAGCASRTASLKESSRPPKTVALAEEPLSGRDYWMLRDFDDNLERMRDRTSSATGRP